MQVGIHEYDFMASVSHFIYNYNYNYRLKECVASRNTKPVRFMAFVLLLFTLIILIINLRNVLK